LSDMLLDRTSPQTNLAPKRHTESQISVNCVNIEPYRSAWLQMGWAALLLFVRVQRSLLGFEIGDGFRHQEQRDPIVDCFLLASKVLDISIQHFALVAHVPWSGFCCPILLIGVARRYINKKMER
jgi:hypothetical protein